MPNRDISVAPFNLYNLQAAGSMVRGRVVEGAEYAAKIEWTAWMSRELDADVIAFQELWQASCLADAFETAQMSDDYELVFVRPSWRSIAVAAAVRRPWRVEKRRAIKKLPYPNLHKADLDDGEDDEIEVRIDRFSRAVLDLTVGHAEEPEVPPIRVFAAHLKSKLKTDVDTGPNAHRGTVGVAISTIRRTAEAAGLRWTLTNVMKGTGTPVVVAGDLNDDPRSSTLAILTQQPSLSPSARGGDNTLYSTLQMQQLSSFRDVFYTHEYNRLRDALDHVLVSEEFFAGSPDHYWSLRDVRIWNDFIDDERKDTSDHGVVKASFVWG